jgi:RNA polymerase sigma factor (sigma-70 family)
VRPGKPYPYNLICDILEDEEYIGGLSHDELIAKIDSMILDLSKTYVRNKHIPARMQSIIQLYYGDGLSHQKIGEMFGISAGRVGQVRRRVLRLLRHSSHGDWLY